MSRWPAVVMSYDRPARQCLVSIPGITDGAEGLIAEIEQNLGDRSEDTEIRILPGDRVWVDFLAGDPRYPIITGFRARNASNMVGTRHWEHENFTLIADQTITLRAGTRIALEVGGTTFTLTAANLALIAATITQQGATTATGGVTIDGIAFGTHTHTEQGDGKDVSAPK